MCLARWRWPDYPEPFIEDIAKAYCEERPLYRPDTSYGRVLFKWFFIFTLASAGVFGGLLLVSWAGRALFSDLRNTVLVSLGGGVGIVLLLLRWLAIDCVELYQRYAPEEVRRRCMLMPTCSTFAILAFRKYGFLIGGCLTWYRLTKRCRGNINRIEYP